MTMIRVIVALFFIVGIIVAVMVGRGYEKAGNDSGVPSAQRTGLNYEEPGAGTSRIAKKDEVVINTLVVTSRNHTRMQPEIFYAFNTTANKIAPMMQFKFDIFNPFKFQNVRASLVDTERKILMVLRKVPSEVVMIKHELQPGEKLFDKVLVYAKENPRSELGRLLRMLGDLMLHYKFLIIESSDTYGAHPLFYVDEVKDAELENGANKMDIMETVYGLFLIEVAFEQDKTVWGTCHGSQIGWLYAGGKLGRLFEFTPAGYDAEFNKTNANMDSDEIWRLHKHLYTQKKGDDFNDYEIKAYEVPEFFKESEDKGKKMLVNKDFQHSIGLLEPIPKGVEVISFHPMSEYKKNLPEASRPENKAFGKILKEQVIVDAYKYKTMLGTQYHPQYTYDDLDTDVIFEYLVENLKRKYVKKQGVSK